MSRDFGEDVIDKIGGSLEGFGGNIGEALQTRVDGSSALFEDTVGI